MKFLLPLFLLLLAVVAALSSWFLKPGRPASSPPAVEVAASVRPTSSAEPVAAPTAEAVRPFKDRLLEAVRGGDREMLKALRAELAKEALPPEIPDEENGSLVLARAFEKLQGATYQDNVALDALRKGSATPEQVVRVEALLARNAEAIALLKDAATYAKFRDAAPEATTTHLIRTQQAANLLQAEGLIAKAKGGGDGADQAAIGALARSLEKSPVLVSQFIRYAVLRQGGSATIESIRSIYPATLKMELADRIGAACDAAEPREGIPDLGSATDRARLGHYIETTYELIGIVDRPWYAIRDDVQRIERVRLEWSGWMGETTRSAYEYYSKYLETAAQAEARLGPAIDPFSGRPMLSKDGVTYSVGPNGADDGGAKDDIPVRR